MSPYPPMEALLVDALPTGPGWQYEPKWDGFRCLVFRNGRSVELQSKSGQSLTRYFPEVVDAVRSVRARAFVLDGEIVIPLDGQLSFDDLLQRIHPAESRVKKLSAERPALLVVFDLLADTRGRALVDRPLRERRRLLEAFATKELAGVKGFRLSPATTDAKAARAWLAMTGGTFDGVVAKRLDLEYRSGDRTGMQKVKRLRTVDCVVGGFRYASTSRVVGSLLRKLEPLVEPPGFTGRAPGGPSRWSTARSSEWQPLSPRLVAEVRYDHFTGGRFRHGTRFLRWRPDKKPSQCTLNQVKSGDQVKSAKSSRRASAGSPALLEGFGL